MLLALGLVGVVVVAAAAYWALVLRFVQTTDDAYVGGNVTVMAPKVNGFVTEMLVQDNQRVSAGQVLVRLDSRDYDARLAQANAEVASAHAAVAELQAKRDLQGAVINQQQAEVRASSAEMTRSASDRVALSRTREGRRRVEPDRRARGRRLHQGERGGRSQRRVAGGGEARDSP